LLRVLRGHARAVTSVAFSPDDRRIATGSIDRTARIWDARTGEQLHVLRGHENDLTSVAFSRDGRFLVTASRDKDARTWDARSGAPLRVLVGHFAVVSDASFSPDGRWVVTAGPATAGLWDASSGRLVLYLRGHQGRLTSALFTGARGIITGGVDGMPVNKAAAQLILKQPGPPANKQAFYDVFQYAKPTFTDPYGQEAINVLQTQGKFGDMWNNDLNVHDTLTAAVPLMNKSITEQIANQKKNQ